jgi:uncharacterized protein
MKTTVILSLVTAALGIGACAMADDNAVDPVVRQIVPNKVEPFAPGAVKCRSGLLAERFALNRDYLLSLSNDSMLYIFRKQAGLPTPGKPYGGWCSIEGAHWSKNGEFQCDYLSALAISYAACGDKRLKSQANEFVVGLAACQQPDGAIYSGNVSEKHLFFYTIDKWLKGLANAQHLLGNRQAATIRARLVEWIESEVGLLSDEQLQSLLKEEQGGICEALYDFYAETGQPCHLALARRFEHRSILDPLARGEDNLAGIHANTTIPKILGAARAYELTGDAYYRRVVEKFWGLVAKTRSYATGSTSSVELWGKAHALRAGLLGGNTQETCVTFNWMRLTRYLWRWTGKAEYADLYERCLYNGIVAAQDPDRGMVTYFMSLKAGVRESEDEWLKEQMGGSRKRFGTLFASFWCCTGTGAMALAGLTDSIYFHGGDTLYVNAFTPSEVQWQCGKTQVNVSQETDYPDSDTVRLRVRLSEPTDFAMALRMPWWASGNNVIRVNGESVDGDLRPGRFYPVRRTWRDGDTVELTLPMSLYAQAIDDDPNCVAVMYGPHVMAGLTYFAFQKTFAQEDVKLKGNPKEPQQWLLPVPNRKMMFITKAPDQNVVFIPLYKVVAERYGVYFDMIAP